jgi:hypothetical protein
MQPVAQVTQPYLLRCRFANLGCRAKFRQPLGRSSLDRPAACKDVGDVSWIMDIFDEIKLAALAKGRSALDVKKSLERHGGMTVANAEPETGATFIVTISAP